MQKQTKKEEIHLRNSGEGGRELPSQELSSGPGEEPNGNKRRKGSMRDLTMEKKRATDLGTCPH